jgi:magnesium transporter
MMASTSSQMSVPSRSLLRFLRSQSESVCFFSANPSLSKLQGPGGRAELAHKPSTISNRRYISSTSRKEARAHTSYLDELWPRHCESSPKALPPPHHYHQDHNLHRTTTAPSGIRHTSTKSSRSLGLFQRLLNLRGRNAALNRRKLYKDDLPIGNSYDDPSVQLFNLARALSKNPSGADLKLRCTEFDSNGSVTLVSGEFKKSELIAKYGLLPRDLRKIDSSVLPHILVRPSSILINLLHLRVLIQSDRVLVFDAFGSTDSYTQSLFMYDLEGKLRQKADAKNGNYLPYEFRALEAVLISVTQGLESEFEGVREPVVRVLRELEEDIDREKLRYLLIHSKKLATFEQKARLVRDAINDLLEADDDLAAMYLTEHKQGKKRREDDHQEVEMLLEAYHKVCDEIVEVSGNLISNIRNTEEVIRAILDANRNQLMLLEIKFSIGTLGLAAGTLIAGLYGMNLKNFIEESDVAFSGVTVACFGLSAIVCVYGMRRLRRIQKVRMWGEGYGSDLASRRGNWRSEAMEHAALPWGNRAERVTKSKDGKGPVLWPGMDGLGMNSGKEPATVTIHDDLSASPQKVVEKRQSTPLPPVPPVQQVKKKN